MVARRILVSIILVVAVGCTVGLRSLPQAKDIGDSQLLEPGDILFVDIYDGECFWGYWDHIAIYVGEQMIVPGYSDRAVVEATFDGGIVLTQVDAFISRDRPAEVSVKRLKDIEGRQMIVQGAVEYALAQEGKPFDPAVFVFPLFQKVGDRAFHCAEVVWRAYKHGGIDLDSNGELMLLPDDIYYSPYLRSV